MNEPKFKVGDRVRVLDGSKIYGYKGGWAKDTMTAEIGKLHTITGIEKDKSRIGYNLDFRKTNFGLPYIWDERGLELVEPENAPKFKVGDKVTIPNGREATVIKMWKTHDLQMSPFWYGVECLDGLKTNYLESELKRTFKPKFQIGDKVRIAESKNKEMIGKTATINQVFFDNQSWSEASVYEVSVDNKKTLYSEVYLEAAKESNPKFKVGDKVIVKRIGFGIIDMELIGKDAVITRVDKTSCWGSQTYGIDLDGGLYWFEQMLEAVPNKVDHKPKIVITTDGKTTLARLYEGKKVIKTAEAHCSPDDTFDFSVGANLAMERLIGKTTAKASTEIPKEITDKFETIKATGKAFVKALEEFK